MNELMSHTPDGRCAKEQGSPLSHCAIFLMVNNDKPKLFPPLCQEVLNPPALPSSPQLPLRRDFPSCVLRDVNRHFSKTIFCGQICLEKPGLNPFCLFFTVGFWELLMVNVIAVLQENSWICSISQIYWVLELGFWVYLLLSLWTQMFDGSHSRL